MELVTNTTSLGQEVKMSTSIFEVTVALDAGEVPSGEYAVTDSMQTILELRAVATAASQTEKFCLVLQSD